MNNIKNISKINIEASFCNKCGNCTFACPWQILQSKDNNTFPKIVNHDLCVSCGHCIAICPNNAIMHPDFNNADKKRINNEYMPSYNQILELFRTRRSIRKFSDKPVEKDVIRKIIESSCYAPSTNNSQSTEFIVVQKTSVITNITEITAKYLERVIKINRNPVLKNIIRLKVPNKTVRIQKLVKEYEEIIKGIRKQKDLILHNAPVLLFFNADRNIGFSDVNASLALQNAALAIHSLGLGGFYAGYVVASCRYNRDIQKLINLPNNFQVYGCLAFGYPKLIYRHWIERKKPKIQWIT